LQLSYGSPGFLTVARDDVNIDNEKGGKATLWLYRINSDKRTNYGNGTGLSDRLRK